MDDILCQATRKCRLSIYIPIISQRIHDLVGVLVIIFDVEVFFSNFNIFYRVWYLLNILIGHVLPSMVIMLFTQYINRTCLVIML